MRISLICPSRGRPYSMARFVHSAISHSLITNNTEVCFRLDDDDSDSIQQFEELRKDYDNNVKAFIGNKDTYHSQMNNDAQSIATGDIYMYAGDDLTFNTHGWDQKVIDAFNTYGDHICLVYGNDGLNGEKLATHGFLHKKAAEIVGYFMPPYYVAFYADTFWTEVYFNLGRKLYIDIDTPHLHYTLGKSPFDETSKIMHNRHNVLGGQIWYQTLHYRVEAAQKLANYLNITLSEYKTIL